MTRFASNIRAKFVAWGQWRVNGGWSFVEPLEADNGLKIRAPGTHTDPTLARIVGMEMAGDSECARVDIFIHNMPRLRKSLVYATYYYSLIDRMPQGKTLVDGIIKDYGISSRVYYDQMRAATEELGEWLSMGVAA